MQLYLAAAPSEVRDAARFTRSLVHVAYRIGPSSSLLRRDLLLDTRGGLLSISDRDAAPIASPEQLSAAVLRECGRRGYGGAVLDFEEPITPDRRDFAQVLCRQLSNSRRTLFVPEACPVPGAVILIDTAVSGGSFSEYLSEARSKYGRVALDLQRLSMDFLLPARTGVGTPLTRSQFQALYREQAPSVFFSPELCARYFTFSRGRETHFVLFDDGDTLLRKIRIGASMGIGAGFLMYPETADLLGKLFPGKGANA